MKASVDRDLCIGCRLCEDTCPEVFRMAEDGMAYVLGSVLDPEFYEDVQDCVELCPVSAISLSGE